MGDILRKSLAPITQAAWEEINEEATRIFKTKLTARKVVDIDGPHGWEKSAINLGRLEIAASKTGEGVTWGKRVVQPLIEVRIPFSLNQMEMDNVERGSKDAELEPLQQAAHKLADFEERAIFEGFADGGIQGIIEASDHTPITIKGDASEYLKPVSEGVNILANAGIEGPYNLVLGSPLYQNLLQSTCPGYPPFKMIKDMIGGEIMWSQSIDGGVLLSNRGGDFEFTLGQDISIGYAHHDREKIELYFAESFTFRVLDPVAAIGFSSK